MGDAIRGGYNFLIAGGFVHDDSWPRVTSRQQIENEHPTYRTVTDGAHVWLRIGRHRIEASGCDRCGATKCCYHRYDLAERLMPPSITNLVDPMALFCFPLL